MLQIHTRLPTLAVFTSKAVLRPHRCFSYKDSAAIRSIHTSNVMRGKLE